MNNRYLVTGGGGFVGQAICRALRAQGAKVVSVARGTYPELVPLGVECVQADLSQSSARLDSAFEGVTGVFHVAAKVDMWGRYSDFYKANVEATQNVIRLCRSHGISRLVFTSSPSVVADGSDLAGVDESAPYPARYEAFYPKTKALAERAVLEANSTELYSCALRPHLIFGPSDNNLVPTILLRAKQGRLVQIGDGSNLSDFTYIDDCVNAHLLAMAALEANPQVRGRAYFISQGNPVPLWDFVNRVLALNGLPKVSRRISLRTALALSAVSETVSKILPWQAEPYLTRFLVHEMATNHFFNIGAAINDFRYTPSATVFEALERTFSRSSYDQSRHHMAQY